MTSTNIIFDANPENFAELVVGNSMRGPVMVNFWSAKAGPCLKLWPSLEKLANEYGGRFLLINFNTDKYLSFAKAELGVTSVPTVRMYFQQQVVDTVFGAESEAAFRRMIDRHLPRASDTLVVDALQTYQAGEADQAFDRLKNLQRQDEDNPRIAVTLMKLLFRDARYEQIEEVFGDLPDKLQRHDEIINIVTHAGFFRAAAQMDATTADERVNRDTGDTEAVLAQAAHALQQDEYTRAMDLLLAVMKQDRHYRNEFPVRGMIAVLNLVGDQPELVKTYRNKMLDLIA